MKINRGKSITFYMAMVSPALLIYLAVIAFPVLFSVVLGFMKYNVYRPEKSVFIGFDNYIKMFNDPVFWRALGNNIFVVCVSVFGQIPIGFGLAYILYRKMIRFESFFQAMVFLPVTISTIVVGVLWSTIFSPTSGPATQLLQQVTGDGNAFFDWGLHAETAMMPVGFVMLWYYSGFYMIIFLANLQKLDSGIVEAAMIDGATEFGIFVRIIVPALSGVIVTNAILAISGSLKGFDLIWAMTRGGPANYTEVLPIYMYRYTFTVFKYGYGSAVATVIIMISFAMIGVTRFVESLVGGRED